MENSSFGRLISVLVSPGKTFRAIAERPTWAVVLVVLIAVTAVQSIVVHQRTDYRELTEWTMAQGGTDVSEEQVESIAEMQERFGAFGAVVGGGVVVLFSLLLAFLYWVGIKLVGGELTYRTSLSVSLHSGIPIMVQMLVATLILLPRQSVDVQQLTTRNFLASNLAFLAPEDAGPVLVNLLASLDFFAFWGLVLAVIGFAVAGRVSKTAAAVVVGVIWLLGLAVRLGLAALTGGGAG